MFTPETATFDTATPPYTADFGLGDWPNVRYDDGAKTPQDDQALATYPTSNSSNKPEEPIPGYVSVEVEGQKFEVAIAEPLKWEDLEIPIPEGQADRLKSFDLFEEEIDFDLIWDVFVSYNTYLGSKINRGGGSLDVLLEKDYDITSIMGLDGTDATHPPRQVLRTLHVFDKTEKRARDVNVQEFSQDEKGLLQLVALFHDLGELVHGDVRDGDRDEQTVRQENQTARAIAKAIFSEPQIMGNQALSDQLIDLIFDIEQGERSADSNFRPEIDVAKLYGVWRNQVERVEYLDTAIRVYDNIKNEDTYGSELTSMGYAFRFAKECAINHYPDLLKYLEEHPEAESLRDFLVSNRKALDVFQNNQVANYK